ncbi:MAG TPA: acyl-CoA reductase, partial [Armatimonadota bacterium]|nr:acyl-CoA reductase [Armatimonadota bacterium]
EALAQAEVRMPLRALDPAEAAAVHQYRASIEMRALAREEMRLWSSQGGTRWTVVLETEGELEPSPLNRTAVIRPVDDLDDLPRCIAGRREHLMSAALGVGERRRARLARGLAAAGVTRVTGLGRAQELESDLYHDGVNAVALLARFARVDE